MKKDPTPLNEFPKDIGLQQQYSNTAWSDWDVEDTLNNLETVLKLPFQYKLVNLSHNQIKLLNHKLYLLKVGDVINSKLASSPGYCAFFPGITAGFLCHQQPKLRPQGRQSLQKPEQK